MSCSLLFVVLLLPQLAVSQTWQPPATGPFLREIVAVDASGEANWPFGSEDNAKDGATFGADEARLDIRTAYAASDADRFWLRAYFAETQVTTFETTVLFVFMDSDDNPATGSGADATDIFPELTADPTPGGYDTVIGVQGDGTVLGVWSWETNQSRWGSLSVRAGEVEVESGIDLDPILIFGEDHAYLQMSVDHVLTGLNAACNSTLFVRSFNDATSVRYGDLNVGPAVPCVARDVNADGSPDILQNPTSGCRSNADCPGQGVCLSSGVCLISYQCRANSDCAADETCTNGQCVRVVTTQCTANADCNGLLCEQGACVPCATSGARACASGLVCAPNGTCTDPGTVTPPPNPAGPSPDLVQGGACMCSLAATSAGSATSPLLLLLGFLLVGLRRRRTAAANREEAIQ